MHSIKYSFTYLRRTEKKNKKKINLKCTKEQLITISTNVMVKALSFSLLLFISQILKGDNSLKADGAVLQTSNLTNLRNISYLSSFLSILSPHPTFCLNRTIL